MNPVHNPAPPAPRWTWSVVLASLACTLALFLAVPLLETLRNLNIGPQQQVRSMPMVSEPPPPPPPPMSLPEAPPAPEASAPAPMPELQLPAPPPLLPSTPSMSMPSVFTPTEWTADPLRMTGMPPSAPTVFDIGQIDQAPSPRSQLRPLYPPRARMHRIEGWVDLEFVVTAEGTVEDIRVTGSSPDDIFDRSAVQAASRWRFTPGRHQNKPVAVRVRQRISFELQ
ncbi:MAG: TonB family protein [Verrucomicrobia bacterium]|nr:TonB family protein [Verrucomicrobiota bacterium]